MKLSRFSIFILLLLFFIGGGIYAVNYLPNGLILEQATNGYATPQTANKDIVLADTSCKKITSNTNTQYFIPTKTMGESSAFLSNLPGGVTAGNCVVPECFNARQYSAGRHCDIGGGWWWIDARTGQRDTSPYLFGRSGYAGFNGDTTTNYDAALCKNGASPIQAGDYGFSCPLGSTAYGGGCYYPNTDARRPTECDGANPADECCFFVCPADLSCTAGTCGSADGTTVIPYPNGIQLCTSGNTQNIDAIAADGTYNWGCGSTSCSANRDNTTGGGFCLGIAKPTVDGGNTPQCGNGKRMCEAGSASWQCGGAGWIWNIQNPLCVRAGDECP